MCTSIYKSLDRELKRSGPLGELTAYSRPCLLDVSQRNAIRLSSFAMLRWAKASLCVMIFLEKGKALFISGFSFVRHTSTEHLLCSEARDTHYVPEPILLWDMNPLPRSLWANGVFTPCLCVWHISGFFLFS